MEERRQQIIEDKKKLERRWGWLAHLTASVILFFFSILKTVLKIIFSIISALAQVL